MRVLVLDTASAICAAGLHDTVADRLCAQTELIGTGHAERLMAMVSDVLAEAAIAPREVDLIAATVGPGSFTGVRVGLSAALGLAQALGAPVCGVTTLEAVAASALAAGAAAPLLVAIDARRGEVHAQLFAGDGTPLNAPALLPLAEAAGLCANAKACAGSGATLVEPTVPALMQDRATGDLRDIARIATARHAAGRDLPPRPLYLRGADARAQTGFALARAGASS